MSETAAVPLRLIVGLGNPGRDYDRTRHNIGFELIDALAAAHGFKVDYRRDKSLTGRGTIAGVPTLLVKPQTFMNLSGEAVTLLMQREAVPLSQLLVLCDDIHLPVGRLRLRPRGSSGGQNGLKSVAAHLGSQDWARLRIGVGEPPPGLQVEWVLGKFSSADRKIMDETLIQAMGAVEVWVREGIDTAMNRFNAA
ncbi:MAG: aminoacyl-tRNA hydrolase [Capsulimonadales bacterium]|nr:aminoacyl-tRNA hydrolase [Capsulimonadales bacterium]